MKRIDMKNTRVRKAMMDAKIDQRTLSQILGWNETKLSMVLGVCELAKFEQDDIIKAIKEWANP